MRRIGIGFVIVVTIVFGVLFLGLLLNYGLDEKYLYDVSGPGDLDSVVNLARERMGDTIWFSFSLLLWVILLSILSVTLLSRKKS